MKDLNTYKILKIKIVKNMNLNKIYKELKLIEEFETNFNITKESENRRIYLKSLIGWEFIKNKI